MYSSHGSHCPSDLVIESDGLLQSVEVRLLTVMAKGWQLNVKNSKSDILFVVHPNQDTIWEIPGVLLSHMTTVKLKFIGERHRKHKLKLNFDSYRVDNSIHGNIPQE